jgi:hypothetical protein
MVEKEKGAKGEKVALWKRASKISKGKEAT